MSQQALALDLPSKPCALLTHGRLAEDGSKIYRYECACGAVGEWVGSGAKAAGEWARHAGINRSDRQ